MDKCKKCSSEFVYRDGELFICPECAHEWSEEGQESPAEVATWLDANKQVLTEGDSVVLIKDLKIKGASGVLKKGTKVKNIRLIEPEAGHNIACKIDGVGALNLKSEFVKKTV